MEENKKEATAGTLYKPFEQPVLKKIKETTSVEVVNALLEEGWSLRETGYHDGVFYYLLSFYA